MSDQACASPSVKLTLPITIHVTGPVHVHMGNSEFETKVLHNLSALHAQGEKIMSSLDDANAALKTIDDATTKIGGNVADIGKITQTVSDEIDTFLASATNNAGIPAELLAGLTNTAAKAQLAADASQALVPVLQGIASKGATVPVPTPVPTSVSQAAQAIPTP